MDDFRRSSEPKRHHPPGYGRHLRRAARKRLRRHDLGWEADHTDPESEALDAAERRAQERLNAEIKREIEACREDIEAEEGWT